MLVVSLKNLLALVQILLGVLGLTIASQINIPLEPVPVNLGTVAVMLIGLQYPFRAAVYSLMCYLLIGIAGAPVFNNFHGGIIYFFGPTCGYLIGYAIAGSLMAFLRERYVAINSLKSIILLCCIGQLVIFGCGICWLSCLKSFDFAIKFGFLPFIIPGIIKTLLLAVSVKAIRK